jgi:hypothetical protein
MGRIRLLFFTMMVFFAFCGCRPAKYKYIISNTSHFRLDTLRIGCTPEAARITLGPKSVSPVDSFYMKRKSGTKEAMVCAFVTKYSDTSGMSSNKTGYAIPISFFSRKDTNVFMVNERPGASGGNLFEIRISQLHCRFDVKVDKGITSDSIPVGSYALNALGEKHIRSGFVRRYKGLGIKKVPVDAAALRRLYYDVCQVEGYVLYELALTKDEDSRGTLLFSYKKP